MQTIGDMMGHKFCNKRRKFSGNMVPPQREPLTDDDRSFRYTGIPEEEAWWPSRLLFAWGKPLFERARQLSLRGKALEQEDLLPMPNFDYGENISAKFDDAWRKWGSLAPSEVRKLDDLKGDGDQSTARLRRTLLGVMGSRFIVAGIIKVFNSGLQFCFPIILNAILRYIEGIQNGSIDDTFPWYDYYRGYWLSALLLFVMASKAVTESAYFHRVNRAGYQARVAVSIAVYKKSLRLSNSERQSTTLGTFQIKKKAHTM